MLQILECINGFMKTKSPNSNYLFLIPLGKERIKHALFTERNYSVYEQNKYIDKIFDKSITILNHGDVNLFNMLKIKSEEQKLCLTNESLDLLADFYVKTPRDVNKAIDQLKYDFLLNDKKEQLSFVNEKFNNIHLVICFIVKNRWPHIFESIINDRTKKLAISIINDCKTVNANNNINNENIIIDNFLKKIINFNILNKHFVIYNNLKTEEAFYDVNIIKKH